MRYFGTELRFGTAIGVFALLEASSPAQVSDGLANQCTTVYKNAVNNIESTSQESLAIDILRRSTCSQKNRSIDLGFDNETQAIVNSIPTASSIIARGSYKSNKQFCEALDRDQVQYQRSDKFVQRPSALALQNYNQCIEIANSSNLVITHDIQDAGNVVIQGRFTQPEINARISASTGGFLCTSPIPNSSKTESLGTMEIVRSVNFPIFCKRKGARSGENLDYKEDSIVITTNRTGIYKITVLSDSLYGYGTRRQFDAKIDEISSENRQLLSQIERLEQRAYSPVRYFIGEPSPQWEGRHTVTNLGTQFSCPIGQIADLEKRNEEIGKVVCPGGKLIASNVPWAAHGDGEGGCGHKFFVGICEMPKPIKP